MQYDVVIGLEIHAELKTKTKVFCSCKNEFGAKPNANTCPVCTGMPGALPILNQKAVELCIKAGLCFDSEISHYAVMERKNYFYPDLAKAYQISQMVHPICVGGHIDLESGKRIRLNRIHLEEDAGKLTHISKSIGTLVDYNRGGTPLIEIVTEPDFCSASEVDEFLKRVRESLVYSDIADCKMEEGGMRCDVNLSLKPQGATEFGIRTEMKNLNSFKSVTRAIEYEIKRQTEVLNSGEKVVQETRKWDDAKGKNMTMRTKEEAQDYRYFPDPDILPIDITDEDIKQIRSQMPLLPSQRREKYMTEYGLSKQDATHLTSEKYVSDYFEKCVSLYSSPKKISNWILTDLLRLVKDQEQFVFPIDEQKLTQIIKMVEDKKITKTLGLELIELCKESTKSPEEIAKEHNMIANITKEQIEQIVANFIAENPKAVSDAKDDPKAVGFVVGYVMKQTQGKANGGLVKQVVDEMILK